MCDVVWSNCTTAEAKCLDTLFNYGSLVLHNHLLYSAPSARQGLQFTTSSDRRKFHMCQTMYKCLNFLAPLYLTHLFDTQSIHRNTHASATKQLNFPVTRSSLAKQLSALLVQWRGDPYPAMFECDFPTFCRLYSTWPIFPFHENFCMNPVYISPPFRMYW